MRSGSGGGGGGDCGFKSAQGALESAVQSFVAKHSGSAEPGAGRTGQPTARYWGISSWARVGVGRFPLGFGLCALETVRLPRYMQPGSPEAVLSRSRGDSPKVPGVLGAGNGLLRPRDRFVYKHWRALRVRDLLVTKSSPANMGTQRPGRHRLPCSA